MRRPDVNLHAVCDEAIGHLSSLAQLDMTIEHARSVGVDTLTAARQSEAEVLGDIKNAMSDISVQDLTSDRLDLIAALAFEGLGDSPTQQFVANAICERLAERRERFVSRLGVLSKSMAGQWFEVDLNADDIVERIGSSFSSKKREPLFSGDVLAIKPYLLRYNEGGAFGVRPSIYRRYTLQGAAQRGSKATSIKVSLVDAAGNPQATIRPLNGRPKPLSAKKQELPF